MEINHQLAKRLFSQAIDLPESARAEFVRTECHDEQVRSHVLSLLAIHSDDKSDFLTAPIPLNHDAKSNESRDPMLGQQIGNYVVESQLGHGGMGTVYQAVQENPRRKVAIKVLRNDIRINESTLRRFKNESQLLAKLHHPNIAHVYEAGSFKNENGVHPWFAMELVEGSDLREFQLQQSLTREQKLRLLLAVCDAVSHAHSKGVIHRDLKPSNILIQADTFEGADQEVPNPKIVDFGIARATESGRSATVTHSILGTLDYLSPEQVSERRFDLDHRCDIYSLGVVGFELVAGRLPFDRKSGSITDVLRRIGSDETGALARSSVELPSDLMTILTKSLEFDPRRRYQTVQEFAEDIRRFLRKEPVSARPPSTFYRMEKFVRRNKILVAGITTTMLAMAAGLISYAVIANQANKAAEDARYEARKAVAVNSFITNDFLTRLLNKVRNNEPQNVEDLIDSSAASIETIYAGQPVIEAAVRNEVGTIYYNVNLFSKASEQYRNSFGLWESELGAEHPDTLKALNNLAQTQLALGAASDPETEQLCRRAYEGRVKILGAADPATLRSLNNLAEALRAQKRLEEAEALYRSALEIWDRQEVVDHTTLVTLLSNLGALTAAQGKMEQAIEYHRRSHETANQVFGSDHTIALRTGVRYAQALDRDGKFAAAVATMKPILVEYEGIAISNPAAIFVPYRLSARIHRHMGKQDQARTILNRALKIAQEQPTEFAAAIKKIKRDLKRLDAD